MENEYQCDILVSKEYYEEHDKGSTVIAVVNSGLLGIGYTMINEDK